MKKILLVLIVAVLAISMVSIAGCKTTAATETTAAAVETTAAPATTAAAETTAAPATTAAAKTYNVAFITRDLSDPFCAWLTDSFVKYAAENYPYMKITTYDSLKTNEKQIELIETVTVQKVDCIILQAQDNDAPVQAVLKAKAAGIPTVVVNGYINDKGVSSTVDADPVEYGKTLAEFASQQLPENAKVVILYGPAGHPHADGRNKGYLETFAAKRPDIEILATQNGDWLKDKGMSIMEDWLQTFPQIDGVMAHNDNMALGAIEAIRAAKKLDTIKCYSIDGIMDACQSIKKGELKASVIQNAFTQAVEALKFVDGWLQGTAKDGEKVIVPGELITIDNVDEYIKIHEEAGF
jgi:inositol transport system substrate-binding protein